VEDREGGWERKVDLPKVVSGLGAVTSKDEVAILVDGYYVGGECCGTSRVAQLTDGEEGGITKGREDVGNVCRRRKVW
jgi:hypothetical protein